ncbi:MAG: hypothetical protein WDN67_01635 [Candidatus Moraniibacteriota bacterium]
MWLGELITEKGLGNGVSMIIFAGIVSSLPTAFSRLLSTWDPAQFFTYVLFFLVGAATIAGVILVNEGQRTLPVAYAKRVRGRTVPTAVPQPICRSRSTRLALFRLSSPSPLFLSRRW